MFGLFRSADERALERVLKGCEAEDGMVVCFDGVTRRRYGSVLRDVVKGLRRTGFNPAELLSLIAMILTLIQEIGDSVQKIIDIIRERRGK